MSIKIVINLQCEMGFECLLFVLHFIVFWRWTQSYEFLNENFHCSYIDELHITEPSCPGTECWNSNLQDSSRISLYLDFLDLRISVATGKCKRCQKYQKYYQDIFIMKYHWYLEYLSILHFHEWKCPFHRNATLLTNDQKPSFNYSMGNLNLNDFKNIEIATSSFRINTEDDQQKALKIMKNHIDDISGGNFLNFWNETDFRLGNAFYFGCSVVIRNHQFGITGVGEVITDERVLFITCAFAGKNNFSSSKGIVNDRSCQLIEKQARKSDVYNLCEYPMLSNSSHEFYEIPCQMFYYTSKYSFNKCPVESSLPNKWLEIKPYENVRRVNIHLLNSTTIVLNAYDEGNFGRYKSTTPFVVPPPPPPEYIKIPLEQSPNPKESNYCHVVLIIFIIECVLSLIAVAIIIAYYLWYKDL